jgi:hypothetical protein
LELSPDHERQIGQIAADIGFTHISLSNEIMPMIKIVPRGTSATADAYLTPCIQKYIKGFVDGFDEGLKGGSTSLQFMQSDGGLVPVDNFSGFRAILSGPAGGVVGYALTSYSEDEKQPVIGFDMGGTSTGKTSVFYFCDLAQNGIKQCVAQMYLALMVITNMSLRLRQPALPFKHRNWISIQLQLVVDLCCFTGMACLL